MWWYTGPMNQVPGMDFTGMAHGPNSAPLYLLIACALLVAAYAGRRRKLAYA